MHQLTTHTNTLLILLLLLQIRILRVFKETTIANLNLNRREDVTRNFYNIQSALVTRECVPIKARIREQEEQHSIPLILRTRLFGEDSCSQRLSEYSAAHLFRESFYYLHTTHNFPFPSDNQHQWFFIVAILTDFSQMWFTERHESVLITIIIASCIKVVEYYN